MPRVLYISPFGTKSDHSGRRIDFDHIYTLLRTNLHKSQPEVEFLRHEDIQSGAVSDPLLPLDSVDLVVCDITTHNANCLYDLGVSHGRGKPSILVTA